MIKDINQIKKHLNIILKKVDRIINREYDIEGEFRKKDPKGKYFKKGFTTYCIRKDIRRKYKKKDLIDIILTIKNNLKIVKKYLAKIDYLSKKKGIKIKKELSVINRRIEEIETMPKRIIQEDCLRERKEKFRKEFVLCKTYKESDIVDVWFIFTECNIFDINRCLKEILKKIK